MRWNILYFSSTPIVSLIPHSGCTTFHSCLWLLSMRRKWVFESFSSLSMIYSKWAGSPRIPAIPPRAASPVKVLPEIQDRRPPETISKGSTKPQSSWCVRCIFCLEWCPNCAFFIRFGPLRWSYGVCGTTSAVRGGPIDMARHRQLQGTNNVLGNEVYLV